MLERKQKIKTRIQQWKERKWLDYAIILLVAIILSIPLKNIQIRDTHDGFLHLLRLMGTVDTLKIGKFPPLINQNYCNGSGYAINLFYPPFVTYLPLLIKLFVSSYSVVLKIFAGICIALSGITMYQLVYQITKNRKIALLSALFYLIAPYKLANVYKRYAMGEFTAMVFIPIVFLGVYNLFEQDGKKHYYIAIGAIGLILSHTITTLYTALFCILYVLFHLKKLKEKEILKKCVVNVIFILLVSMLFWLPMLEASTKAEYTILNDRIIKTNGSFAMKNTLSFSQFWKDMETEKEEDGTTFQIGLPTILAILLTVFVLKKVKEEYKDFYLICVIFALISIFMASKFFPWLLMPNLLCKLQYPWRMVGFFNFFASFVCGVNVYIIAKQLLKKEVLQFFVMFVFFAWAIYTSIAIMSKFYETNQEKDKIYEANIMQDKKISHKRINRDYMPVKALWLQDTYIETRSDTTYILQGNAQIIEETKQDLTDTLKLQNIEENTILEFPYYYYPGYEIQLITEGKIEKITPVESENGFLSCVVDKKVEEVTIVVDFVGTVMTHISYGISAISLVAFIGYIIYEKRKERAC